jgi:hypothetical protein
MPLLRRRFGCLGSLVFVVVFAVVFYVAVVPWSLHIGGRWTPLGTWQGVGRLRDSAGTQYGLYVRFYPFLRRGRRGGLRVGRRPWPSYDLRGTASACPAGGAKYEFNLRGEISGLWLDTDGKQVVLSLSEPRGPKLRRAFSLYGAFNGQDLVLDDRKTMFMNFRPDGTLTPSGSYTSPVPEKHATVTLSWGSYADFESLCAKIVG